MSQANELTFMLGLRSGAKLRSDVLMMTPLAVKDLMETVASHLDEEAPVGHLQFPINANTAFFPYSAIEYVMFQYEEPEEVETSELDPEAA